MSGHHGIKIGDEVPDFKIETYEPSRSDFGEISLAELKAPGSLVTQPLSSLARHDVSVLLIRRQDRLARHLKPVVHVVTAERPHQHEFLLPGGVFISGAHVWANVTVPGLVPVGMDDFARKMIGHIDEQLKGW